MSKGTVNGGRGRQPRSWGSRGTAVVPSVRRPVLVPDMVALALLAPLSLVLLDVVRSGVRGVLWSLADSDRWDWVARVGFPGVVVTLLVFMLAGRGAGLALPPRPSPRTAVWAVGVAASWLGLVLVVSATGEVFIPGPRTAEGAFSFLGFDVVAEEFLFRGALYELVSRVAPARPGRPSAAVCVGAVLFAASQFQYYGYEFTATSIEQAAFAFPFGLLFGFARRRTGSVWAAIGAHMLMNFPPTVVGLT